MMKQMRENTKIILWVVVVAFVITIFAVWGLDLQSGDSRHQQNLVGRVNGVAVTPQQYQTIYTQLSQQFRNQSGDLTAAQQEMIRDQAWQNIVSNILTNEQIKKLGITVTDAEVLNFLKNSPPPEVQQYFKDKNGNFDYAAYQAALNNPDADWTEVENLARQRIPMVKLNHYLMSQVHVSATEVRQRFAEQNTKMVARYVEFPLAAEDVSGYTPSDDEVKAYYDSHQDQFKDVAKATVEYVRIPVTPSQADHDELMQLAEGIRNDAEKSGDFASQVSTYSEAQTAKVGGETGLLGPTQRDPAVIAAADALKPGEISPPVVTADGIYLVQLIEKKKEKTETKYNMRELFLKLAASTTTQDTLMASARAVQESAAASGDLEAAAKAHGLETVTSPPFAEGFPVPGLGYYPAVSRFAFSSDAGAISSVINDEHNYLVCRLKERTPAQARPLDQVTEAIKQTLIHDRKVTLAMRKADGFVQMTTGTNASFDAAAAKMGYKIAKTDSFTVAQPPSGMMPNAPFALAALALTPDAVSRPVESGNSVYVIDVTGRHDPDQAAFNAGAGKVRDDLYRQKVQEYVGYWYDNVKDKSKIEDLRGTAY
ncbi:MAG TPA: SurA N-terminal domain-containing protein [Candidatus Krumholzibacteria bacterium]|nr:SurA N-terminal domain-containing protein [Candidatus Krumholzibacteria bacterium]